MHIVIISNYKRDHQESMNKFARMLQRGYYSNGVKVIRFRPIVFFGFFWKNTSNGLGKWMSYLDKWILTPFAILFLRLKFLLSKEMYFHIADHSNVPYLFWLPKKKTIVTCHDVLAIRGALGHKDTWCNSSFAGKILQFWILKNLLNTNHIITVSQTSLDQLKELAITYNAKVKNWNVIYNGFNDVFLTMEREFIFNQLGKFNLSSEIPFLLHVGSSLPRKNRIMLLKIITFLGDRFKGYIVFAGKKIDFECNKFIQYHNLEERVKVILNPSNQVLQALYSGCDAFIFPSWSEGFGWPIIEAQACGAPVISSCIMPLPEIGGDGAYYASPNDYVDFASKYLKLKENSNRENLIKAGYNNIERFSTNNMINSYLNYFKKNM